MNICVVAKGFPPEVGGIEEYSSAIYLSLKELVDGQVNAYVFLTGSKEHIDFTRIKKSRLEIVNFLKLFYFILKDKNEDTIFWATTWKVALPLFLLRKKYIVTAHGNEFLRSGILFKKLMKPTYSKAKKIVCVSKYTRNRLLSRFEFLKSKRVVVAHNGISKKFEKIVSKTSGDGKNVVFYTVCRLEKKKNIKNAIIAFEKFVSKNNIKATFRIAGIGAEQHQLKSLVQDLSIEDKVQFYGYINEKDLMQLHTSSDIFLHPNIELDRGSDVEGFGLVVADAAACGNIPIVGNSGGPVEIIEALGFGYVVDGNNVDEILQAMLASSKDGMTDKDRVLRKNKAISNFNWKAHVLEATKDLGILKNAQ
jgi:phosphatidylinositol alpha-1,6-mannosyltransferase